MQACSKSLEDKIDDNLKQSPQRTPSGEVDEQNEDSELNNLTESESSFNSLGVGGGGAMSGVSISPFNDLWFVGTDMGTLFRSIDKGKSWRPVNHYQAVFDSHLPYAVSLGFSSDGNTVFHASAGINLKRSIDAGITFENIDINLDEDERISYFQSDSYDPDLIYIGTNKGLFKSTDKGSNWNRVSGINGQSRGTFIDYNPNGNVIYHATETKIFKSTDYGQSFSTYYSASNLQIRQFTGGRSHLGLTLSFIDNDGANACAWAEQYLNEWGENSINQVYENCGFVWINKNGSFIKNSQTAGNHIKMSENDSDTIYVTGGKEWIRQYGTKVFVTHDTGVTWNLMLNQIDWDTNPFAVWPSHKIEYSAVALDVGWWDSGYESFEVHRRNSNIASGSGYFFLHTTYDAGETWKANFTTFKDTGDRTSGKKWLTTGIEVISIYKIKFHPENPNLMYGASADIGGIISEDHGSSFRISKAQYNSNYDYAFDIDNDQIVYAASGNEHDYPANWHANATKSEGGIYKSSNRGKTWSRLTPNNNQFNRQFLSVAYDSTKNHIYAGTQEIGIARSTDNGATWSLFNNGLPNGNKIIPQIEIDPKNGNVYALLTGNAPDFTNYLKTGIYFLDVENNATTWTLLRGTVHYPSDADPGYQTWFYPTGFAIDFSESSDRNTIWMIDYENNGNWLMSGVWKTTNRGNNWHRVYQMTHPTDIKIDPTNPEKVHVAGSHYLDNSWGNGGQVYSPDGGITWFKNEEPALQHNARSIAFDPNDSKNIYYSYFGGGILTGPNPN
jgi:photosystem II stability/assembly factor-like uncharacterized protein